jgi:nickel-dependent lactate racemase
MDVPVNVNRRIFDYDQIIIAGPVFPHEVVGFSGGNKYLFPGVSGPEVLNFFHWLGAVVTNPMIIGNKYTPVLLSETMGQVQGNRLGGPGAFDARPRHRRLRERNRALPGPGDARDGNS